MGSVRDFLRGIGLLSSAGVTLSNTGVRLLNIKNDLDRLAKQGSSPSDRTITAERLVGESRAATSSPAPAGAETPLERKRRLARESMRRLRARNRKGITAAQLKRKRTYNRERMRRLRAR